MHSRRQIIENQEKFRNDIIQWLRKNYLQAKNELLDINSEDQDILKAKKSLLEKTKRINFPQSINTLFINERNLYPKLYAFWNDNNLEVEIYKNPNI